MRTLLTHELPNLFFFQHLNTNKMIEVKVFRQRKEELIVESSMVPLRKNTKLNIRPEIKFWTMFSKINLHINSFFKAESTTILFPIKSHNDLVLFNGLWNNSRRKFKILNGRFYRFKKGIFFFALTFFLLNLKGSKKKFRVAKFSKPKMSSYVIWLMLCLKTLIGYSSLFLFYPIRLKKKIFKSYYNKKIFYMKTKMKTYLSFKYSSNLLKSSLFKLWSKLKKKRKKKTREKKYYTR